MQPSGLSDEGLVDTGGPSGADELSLPADTCIYEARGPIYGRIEKPS
jgi:hypothetical protein